MSAKVQTSKACAHSTERTGNTNMHVLRRNFGTHKHQCQRYIISSKHPFQLPVVANKEPDSGTLVQAQIYVCQWTESESELTSWD